MRWTKFWRISSIGTTFCGVDASSMFVSLVQFNVGSSDQNERSYIPGWDCHGLPIENKALKELGVCLNWMFTAQSLIQLFLARCAHSTDRRRSFFRKICREKRDTNSKEWIHAIGDHGRLEQEGDISDVRYVGPICPFRIQELTPFV